jgi:hypothetical protein
MSVMIPFLPAIAVGAAATQAVGQLAAGESAKAAAEQNAAMMRQEAEIARRQGVAQSTARERATRQFLGRQRAAIGQAGIGFEGSAQDVMLESATAAELDVMNTMYEAELRAKGLMNQATITSWEGKQARRASRMAAVGSVLTGAANYGMASQGVGRYNTTRGIGAGGTFRGIS